MVDLFFILTHIYGGHYSEQVQDQNEHITHVTAHSLLWLGILADFFGGAPLSWSDSTSRASRFS